MKNSKSKIRNQKRISMTRIQNLPESTKKIILWSIMIIISLGLLVFYIKNIQERLKNFELEQFKEELQLPSFEKELEELEKIETPKIEMPKP